MTGMERPLRAAILGAAGNPLVRQAVGRYGMRLGAKRFVAGESAEEFLDVARRANAEGFSVAGGILGESVRDAAAATAAADRYCALLETFATENLDANVAFKLTHVGLDLDRALALENADRIVRTAEQTGNTVRIDMEQSGYVDATLDAYRQLRARYAGIGFVLQSYLFRSRGDLEAAFALQPNVRIVKGAYLESPAIAYARKRDVDENYLALAESALTHDGYTAIATHDPAIVERVERVAQANGVPKRGRFEFQLLYGIGTPLAQTLRDRGYRVRLAVPFGDEWFPYLMRRLAERPANLAFFLKGAFGG
ncbi:MAG TPA: proline dehydrogenase family protein [Candidatus Tumulicola sp.]|jgi:proline dehydrogenase